MHHCRVGDDQGSEGACAIFAMASWAEIRYDKAISNSHCFDTYHKALKTYNRPQGSGLYFHEAFAACKAAGIIRQRTGMFEATLDDLYTQPLVAGYTMTRAFDNVSSWGCLDHGNPEADERGYHAVCIVGKGYGPHEAAPSVSPTYIWIENSWGLSWGWKGLGVMTQYVHSLICKQMFKIVELT